ncbi:MAG: glycoside hydrolase family 5 protein [Fibrobacteres bacterium]|nr:glycoside hydrolase family 5 protein [Fibrobacterota bacterium]
MLRFLLLICIAISFQACEHATSVCGCVVVPPALQADFPSAKALNARLGQGVNLGNALDAYPAEGAWGVTLKADYFRWIADSGFKSVRIPVRFSAHALVDSPYTIDSVFMDRVDWAVKQALDNHLLAILDMHHYDSLMAHPQRELPRFLSMWKQICKRFRDAPPEVLFELLNEPQDQLDAATWNGFLAQAIDTIRVLQPGRTLVVGTAPWGGLGGLSALRLPADTNLIVTIHYYDPHTFTHQGAAFEDGADQWLGTTWRATPAQRAVMDQDLATLRDWSAEQDRPVFMGEFGTYFRADTLSRALWTEYMTRKMDSSRISWALWNFSSDFGIMNDTTEAWKGYLMKALLHHGSNPLLDSILGASTPIDAGVYVTMDDFEDSLVNMPASARKWREHQGIPLTDYHSNWYTFHSGSSTLLSGDGTPIHDYKEVDSGTPPNFDLLVGPWGSEGNGVHVKMRAVADSLSPNPWAGFGAGILGGYDSTFVDLTKLTAIQFRAKGKGDWCMEVISDTVSSDPDSTERWGQMSAAFRPKTEWETVLIPADILAAKPYSKQAKQHLTWEDVRKKIIALEFMNGHCSGEQTDTTSELYLDDIRLIGVTNADLGM